MTLTCALAGCDQPVRPAPRAKYCSYKHQEESERLRKQAYKRIWYATQKGGGFICAREGCRREIPSDRRATARFCSNECYQKNHSLYITRQRQAGHFASATRVDDLRDGETRQSPLRPVWHLEWHPEIVIKPTRQAGVKRDSNGLPAPFQDDLNAILDHGSPVPISRAKSFHAPRSALA